jgi:uncharacterized membrane protein YjgN (DUF898 family)
MRVDYSASTFTLKGSGMANADMNQWQLEEPEPPKRKPTPVAPQNAASTQNVASQSPKPPKPLAFQFTGTGAEYFRIWVVNLLLTILTLGIYSAWAKVRRLQYFYRNTRLGGATFDYHGKPMAILKGRILAFTLIAAYEISSDISLLASGVVAFILLALLPWLLARAFRFKMVNSSYRGLRFNFHGTVKQAYRTLILFPVVLGVLALFLWSAFESFSTSMNSFTALLLLAFAAAALAGLVPLAHYFLKHFQVDHSYFGQSPFFINIRIKDFFQIYAKALGWLMAGSIAAGIFGMLTHKLYLILAETMFGWLFTILYSALSAYLFYVLARAFLESRLQNLVWNHTEIAYNRFESKLGARWLLWIHLSNMVLIILTFGLYKPFAVIRVLKFKVEHMRLVPSGNLEEFLADQTTNDVGAMGQEAGNLFDIDIAL